MQTSELHSSRLGRERMQVPAPGIQESEASALFHRLQEAEQRHTVGKSGRKGASSEINRLNYCHEDGGPGQSTICVTYVRCFFMPPPSKKNLSAKQAFKRAHKSGRAKFKNAQMRDALNNSAHIVYQARAHKIILTLIFV
jgi:hypothetical protein